jgi:hypothetical protein
LAPLAFCGLLLAVRAIAPPGSLEWLDYLPLAGYLAVLLAHKVGVPGVLEHNGLCGWGMCDPAPFGWAIAAVFWFLTFALLSWVFAWLLTRNHRARS